MSDLTHLAGRIPDGHGDPGEDDRRHQVAVAGPRMQIAARMVVDSFASDDQGAAVRTYNASNKTRHSLWARGS